jgi:hypothetical protein
MKHTNKKTIKLSVTVADITYSHRVVEFPSVCPSCKADLTLDGAMDGVEYSSEERPLIVEEDGRVDYDENEGPSCFDGAGSIGWLFVSCRKCNQTLAAGEEKDVTKVAAKAV